MKVAKWGSLILLLWVPLSASALSSDKQQPIHIEADSVVIDDGKGTAVYKGNVHYTQGSTHLDADKVTVYSADRHKVDKVVANGAPAEFRQRPDNRDQDIKGKAGHIEYYADEQRVVLEEDAHLWQGTNEFAGSRIEYDMTKETVKALKSENNENRVQVIIQPRSADDATTESVVPQ